MQGDQFQHAPRVGFDEELQVGESPALEARSEQELDRPSRGAADGVGVRQALIGLLNLDFPTREPHEGVEQFRDAAQRHTGTGAGPDERQEGVGDLIGSIEVQTGHGVSPSGLPRPAIGPTIGRKRLACDIRVGRLKPAFF